MQVERDPEGSNTFLVRVADWGGTREQPAFEWGKTGGNAG